MTYQNSPIVVCCARRFSGLGKLCFGVVLSVITVGLNAQYTFSLTDRGVIPFAVSGFNVTSMNNLGDVVGYTYDIGTGEQKAFLYSGGTFTNLGQLDAVHAGIHQTAAFDINDAQQIVGYSTVRPFSSVLFEAFLYDGGTMTGLGLQPGYTQGFGINSSGVVVGLGQGAYNGYLRGFQLSGGTWQEIGTLASVNPITGLQVGESDARSINNSGQIVGSANSSLGAAQHAIIYQGGVMTDLGTLGGTASSAIRINNNGVIIGQSTFAVGNPSQRAFVYQGGMMTDLGTLGGTSSTAFDINDAGQIIGEAQLASSVTHSFFYAPGTGMLDLTLALSLSDGSVPGFTGFTPSVINDAGEIAGVGFYYDGSQTEMRLVTLIETRIID